LADALPATSLVHGDITADHVFVDRAELVGLIDWGDALIADPYYELVAVYFDAFGGQRPLLTEFLRGYRWDRADEFCRRAIQGVLEFEFDAHRQVSEMPNRTEGKALGNLAKRLLGENLCRRPGRPPPPRSLTAGLPGVRSSHTRTARPGT